MTAPSNANKRQAQASRRYFSACCMSTNLIAAMAVVLVLSFGLVDLNLSFIESELKNESMMEGYEFPDDDLGGGETSSDEATSDSGVMVMKRSDFPPRPPSNYEQRKHGWKLPTWARKSTGSWSPLRKARTLASFISARPLEAQLAARSAFNSTAATK